MGSIMVSDELLAIVRKAMQSLKKEYTDQKVNTLSQDMNKHRNALEQYINTANGQILSLPVSQSPEQAEFYNEMIEDTDVLAPDHAFKEKAKGYKLAERAFNKAMVVNIVANERRNTRELTLIINSLYHEDGPLLAYLAQQKQEGTREDTLITITKQSITTLVDTILDQYVYDIE
jgi:hypothetical protein